MDMSTVWGRNKAAYSSLSLQTSAHPRDVLETVKDPARDTVGARRCAGQ